ncbi:MAG: alanine--tRNA ligase [Eubacteriales bacterium]|nr:alanine--tRNA ligase [Eubacteriales bacterium]
MEKLGLNEIRERFLSFFESKGCLRLDSFSLVPKNDASLLLINSGMAPMKSWFQNPETAPQRRVTTCQKCIRTGDIENVGKTARHGTFFEMLGNFSFGDYFKKEATAWAWEFFTQVMEIPADRLWISVYEEDDEARDIWINEVGVDASHIVRLGKEDNFWEHGTGPCGPCSEIHFDRGVEHGCGKDTCGVGCDCDRFMEVWNLVFTQFDKDEEGNYNRLPNPNIDTGMGLERLAVVMQGVNNLFEVDTVQDVMNHICKIANLEYHKDAKKDVSLRVITDHIRSTVMMVADGVIPSNEGRGYVLRRLLRRAARHGKLLNIDRQFLFEVASTVIDCSKGAYPELEENREYIKKIIQKEEERFDATIDNGLVVLNGYIDEAKKEGRNELSGEEAFKLHDTFGFPLDLTIEMAQEQGLGVDIDGFNASMKEQKETARNARKDGSSWDGEDGSELDVGEATEFVGYTQAEVEAKVLAVSQQDDSCLVVLDKSPFYAEMGGQIGDSGVIENKNFSMIVNDTQKLKSGVFVHSGMALKGEVEVGDTVTAKIDLEKRAKVERNHSATHLLQKALKMVLGDHVAQSGSYVTDEKLRFDFTHFEAMTAQEINKVQNLVNSEILNGLEIKTEVMNVNDAKSAGAQALFGEKYGETVRVISMGDFSKELCGGTHLTNTAKAGLFRIISENGVSTGVRRIEAVTGTGVIDLIDAHDKLLIDAASSLKISNINDVPDKVKQSVEEAKELSKTVEQLKEKLAGNAASELADSFKDVKGVKVLAQVGEGITADEIRSMGDQIKGSTQEPVVFVMAGIADGKIAFVAMANKEAVAMGAHAGNIIREITKAAGGSGGGKPDMAQGGGKDADKVASAIALVEGIVEGQIK